MHTRRLPGTLRALSPVVLVFFLFSPSAARPVAVTVAAVPQAAAKTAAPSRVDGDTQMQDLQALASPDLEGRLTGTPGSRRAQALILERFKQLKLQPVNESFEQTFSFAETRRGGRQEFPDATNLVAMIPGTTDRQSYVLVSAHYDHLGVRDGQTYPGADDNASGVAAMLAIARWFAAHPPRKSLLFVAFDAEEEGLQGSRHFVANPPVELKRISAVVNMDMVGRGDANTLFVAGTRYSPKLAPIVTDAARGRQLTLTRGHDQGGGSEDWTNSSDHGPFHAAGIPFVYFGVEDHPDYHRPGDTADKIPRRFYLEATEIVLETVRALAEGDAQ
jgi:Peptidase family M28